MFFIVDVSKPLWRFKKIENFLFDTWCLLALSGDIFYPFNAFSHKEIFNNDLKLLTTITRARFDCNNISSVKLNEIYTKKVLLYTSKCTRNKDLHQFSIDFKYGIENTKISRSRSCKNMNAVGIWLTLSGIIWQMVQKGRGGGYR